jgi:hypothetical protein
VNPLQDSASNASSAGQFEPSGPGPLERLTFVAVEFALALGTFVLAYLLVRVVLVALTNRVLPSYGGVGQVKLAAKVVAFAFAVVVGTTVLNISIPSLGGLTVLAFAGPFVFALALGTVGLERALGNRGLT